jgi:hypothetical protein
VVVKENDIFSLTARIMLTDPAAGETLDDPNLYSGDFKTLLEKRLNPFEKKVCQALANSAAAFSAYHDALKGDGQWSQEAEASFAGIRGEYVALQASLCSPPAITLYEKEVYDQVYDLIVKSSNDLYRGMYLNQKLYESTSEILSYNRREVTLAVIGKAVDSIASRSPKIVNATQQINGVFPGLFYDDLALVSDGQDPKTYEKAGLKKVCSALETAVESALKEKRLFEVDPRPRRGRK